MLDYNHDFESKSAEEILSMMYLVDNQYHDNIEDIMGHGPDLTSVMFDHTKGYPFSS